MVAAEVRALAQRSASAAKEIKQLIEDSARTVDAGHDKAELFLVKLALLNAQALGDAATVQRHIQSALQDL